MGAENQQEARGVFKNLFSRRIGTTIVREQAKWMRTRVEQAVADANGGPRFGERARRQTAHAREDHASYADAYAEHARR